MKPILFVKYNNEYLVVHSISRTFMSVAMRYSGSDNMWDFCHDWECLSGKLGEEPTYYVYNKINREWYEFVSLGFISNSEVAYFSRNGQSGQDSYGTFDPFWCFVKNLRNTTEDTWI